MNITLKYVLLFWLFFSQVVSRAQLAAPDLRCLSVAPNGDVTLTWINTPDPTNIFTRYDIWMSPVATGLFSQVGSVTSNVLTTFTHVGAAGDAQAKYYYIETISNGTSTSSPSDTLRSIKLSLVNDPQGIALLNWNAMHVPLMLTSATTYSVMRQNPPSAYNEIKVFSQLKYNDTINECNIFYNYKILISDASGCVSQSSLVNGNFIHATNFHTIYLDSVSVNEDGTTTVGWPLPPLPNYPKYIVYQRPAGTQVELDTVFGYTNTVYTYAASTATVASENYEVTSVDKCGLPSGPSPGHRTIFLNAPKYNPCNKTANLTWTPYEENHLPIKDYKVYTSLNGAPYVFLADVTGLSYVHQNLTPFGNYKYLVRAVNAITGKTFSSSNRKTIIAYVPPTPTFVYIKSVSVNLLNTVDVSFAIDSTKPYTGIKVLKSIDNGITYAYYKTLGVGTRSIQSFNDADVSPTEKNYYYQLVVLDSCGNDGVLSNQSKTIKLKVANYNESIYSNYLTWDDYTSWLGTVDSYNIYRAINGIFDAAPFVNVNSATKMYVDNVEDFVRDQGKVTYYVEAVEGLGNIHGFVDKATSNKADAYVEAQVFVPNAFYPRGLNKIWLPVTQYVEKTDYKVTVFSRWGQKVFETTSDTQGWDGQGVTDDVYVYLVEYKNARGEFIQLKGHLTMIR